jgi:thioredoxin reductase (NADPH)
LAGSSSPSAIGPTPAPSASGCALTKGGYLTVEGETTASAIDGIFIAGDIHDHRYRQAITAAGEGARAAIDAERWLETAGAVSNEPATLAAVR